MMDTFERLTAMRDRIDQLMKGETERAEKLSSEMASLERDLMLANALAALKAASADCKHERVRTQVNGARDMIQKALAG